MNDRKSVLNGVNVVVFDLDGTLYDKRGLAGRMIRRMWWCLPLLAAERLARRNMHYVCYSSEAEFYDAFFRTMARGHLWGPMVATTWYCSLFMPTMVRMIRRYHHPRPEMLEMIEECKARKIRMAIYSDYGFVMDKLEALGIDPNLFELKVAAPSFGALKPSAECAKRLMKILHADPKTTLFVGDRDDKDGESARSVGARFLLVG